MTFSILLFFSPLFWRGAGGEVSAQKEKPLPDCPSSNDDALKLYRKSQDKKQYEYAERIKFSEQCVEEDPNYAPANYELGMHWQRRADETDGPCDKCEQYFLAVIRNCPAFHSNPYFYLGKLYFEQEKYDSAVKYMNQFLNFRDDDVKKYDKLRYERYIVDAKRYIGWANFYKETLGHPVPYDPKILEGISTTREEYLPFISPDNEIIFFTRVIPVNQMNSIFSSGSEHELFCYSDRQANGKFSEGQPMPSPPFNQHANEGGASVTIDNKHLFFTVNDNSNFDIYTSDFVNGEWREVRSLGKIVNSEDYWDSQPSISADGKTLYFASNRPGGYGGVDIWKTVKDVTGNWTLPVNLGSNINTAGDEKSPFLHWDSKTLYFSSGENEQYGGHMSVGKFDIFYARIDSTGKWGKPKNIGYPINTIGDDVGFFVSTDGRYGYFSSDNPQKTLGKNVGGKDIYYFELPQNTRPDAVAILKGKVTNEDGKAVSAANVELKDVVTQKTTKAMVDSATGEYVVAANVQKQHDQLIIVKKEGYAFSSQLLSVNDSSTKQILTATNAIEKKITVKPIEIKTDSIKEGKAFTLNNIYFGPSRSDLKEESKFVLDEFVEYMKENPTIKIDIYGHTDDLGNDQDNQNLSADRAFTVFEYLRNHGVDKEQIVNHKGFGETKPVASNDTEEGRAKNRRTEFMIVSK
ncbi:MAG: OmpA family protein [Bacteroidetes bacterium]|nr:OmpA family protein [Bacteroidota bacterium]